MKVFRNTIQVTVSILLLATLLGISVRAASAAEGSGNTTALAPLSVTLTNGRVFWDLGACNSGRCSAKDVDPSSAGPLRPWQSNLTLTSRGIQTSASDAAGNAISFLPIGNTVCFNVPFTDELSIGGINKYYVAYWDASLDNCDNDWNTDGPNKTSVCKKSIKGNWYPLPNTSRQLLANRTYDVCGYLMLPATYALVIAK